MPYNVKSVATVLPMLDKQLAKMRAETDRNQLKDISADDAYELGYETAIHDIRHWQGPDPREVQVVSHATPQA